MIIMTKILIINFFFENLGVNFEGLGVQIMPLRPADEECSALKSEASAALGLLS